MVRALSIRNATKNRRMSCVVAEWMPCLTALRGPGVLFSGSFVSSLTFVEACDRLDSLIDILGGHGMVWPLLQPGFEQLQPQEAARY